MVKMTLNFLQILSCLPLICLTFAFEIKPQNQENGAVQDTPTLFSVEGKLTIRPELQPKPNVFGDIYISLDYGRYQGFVRSDGTFKLNDIPTGSYIIEAISVDYTFEPLRIDITNKGKIRARKLNLLQPNVVVTMPYPVKMTALHPTQYFRKREEWRVTDVLMNPMIIMLIAAFLLMVITPKLAAQDPQMQKDMQNLQLPKMDMPDMADMLANMFGSSSGKKGNTRKAIASQNTKRTTR
uniref:ER membrane protein complex subunit 7 beta-sandwich domain-containing protein n=1 Tax=Meloidogyne enterolobii TaxID=390850 RepID=A0A6V7WA14_MELEN|nr:unnamed protein product [Meloidogyne enterolobii]